jgi:site-specific DNA recombinase
MDEIIEVAEYLRKSRAEENMDTEDVLKRHHTSLLEYTARSPNIRIIDTYKEVKSGESLYARPEMLRLLSDVEAGKYDGILCMDIDRLSRGSMTDQGIILDTLKLSDTKIYTPDKIYDLSDDLDDQMAEFKTFLSRQEYRLIRNRMQRGLRRTIADGCYVANAPFGYRKVWVNRRPTLEIAEEEAHFVRMMFHLYESGIGCTSIANHINSLGAKPRRSAEFNRSTVAKILRNPTYTGKIVWDQKKHIKKGTKGSAKLITIRQPREKWLITDGIHPPIISEEQYTKVQEIMSGRYIPPSNLGITRNPLSGLIRCARCGKNMQRMAGASRDAEYLMCNTRGCCAGAKFELVEAAILTYLHDTLAGFRLTHETVTASSLSTLTIALQTAENDLKVAAAAKIRLYELLEQGVYDETTFWERMAANREKIANLESRNITLQEKITEGQTTAPIGFAKQIEYFQDAYDSADPAGRNQLLRSIIDHISYSKEKKSRPADFTLIICLKRY